MITASADVPLRQITRYDLNIASGIIHAAFSGGVCSFSPDSLLNTSRYTYTVTPPGPTEPTKQTSPWWAITGFAAMLLSIMFVVLKKRIRSKKRKEYSRREFLLSAGANAAGKIIEKKRLDDPDAEFLYKLQNAVEEKPDREETKCADTQPNHGYGPHGTIPAHDGINRIDPVGIY